MSDKLFNLPVISEQIKFDQYGGYQLTEVLDLEVLEAVGGGLGIEIKDMPPMNILCFPTTTTNYCPPKPTTSEPTPPKPTEKDPPKAGEDGDE